MNKVNYFIIVILTILIVGCSNSFCSLQAVAGGSNTCHEGVASD